MIAPVLRAKIIIPVIFFSLVILLSFSYYTVQVVTGVGDHVIYGKKQSEIAHEIRQELLQYPNIQKVTFKTSDKIALSGLYFKKKNAQANILLCHGFHGFKEHMFGLLKMFPNFNILMFDFRAHGQSEGTHTSLGCHEYKDVIAGVKFLKEQCSKTIPTIALGISMGGSSCIKALEKCPTLCDALIIDSAFSDLRKMFLRGFSLKCNLPHYPFFPILRSMFHYCARCDISKMSPVESIKHIDKPILFIHSCDDAFIPPENSLNLYAHAHNKNTKVWVGPRCRHGWLHTYYPHMYERKVQKFLKNALA
ncbi:MAG: alpha/beta fold hydrolase [bacterium]